MKEYKICKIVHSGTQGERGTEKRSPYDIDRIGRTVTFDLFELRKMAGTGKFVYLQYLKDKDGNDLQFRAMRMSPINSINWFGDKTVIVVETENTIYTFKEVANK